MKFHFLPLGALYMCRWTSILYQLYLCSQTLTLMYFALVELLQIKYFVDLAGKSLSCLPVFRAVPLEPRV